MDNVLTPFILTSLIVGFVTAGLNIRFDRFFTILLLLFLFKFPVKYAINVFLWIIFLGSLTVILNNKDNIIKIPTKFKFNLFVIVPLLTLFSSLAGSLLFFTLSQRTLIVILAILAFIYGLRLVFVHFNEEDLKNKEPNNIIMKLCRIFGPVITGFFIGLVGTSLKPVKIPLGVKLGKMNLKQVYLGNVITAFFSSLFSIIWHYLFNTNLNTTYIYETIILGSSLWTFIHFISEITNIFFKEKWRKTFQIIIGILLILVSIKLFYF